MNVNQVPRFVSAAEITRNFGMWQDKVGQGPVIVTHHGRPRVAMISADDFDAFTGLAPSDGDAGSVLGGLDAIRFAILAEHGGGGFIAFDRDLQITHVNGDALAHLGQPAAALIGKTVDSCFPEMERGPVVEALRRVADGGEAVQIDAPSVLRPERLLRVSLFPFPNGVAMVFRNVAEEIRAEQDARERSALQAAREAHGRAGVGRLSLRATFEHVEPGFAAMAGFGPERLRGVKFTDLLALGERAAVAQEIEAVLAGGETRRLTTTLLVNGGGEMRVTAAAAPIREGFGITGAMLFVTVEA